MQPDRFSRWALYKSAWHRPDPDRGFHTMCGLALPVSAEQFQLRLPLRRSQPTGRQYAEGASAVSSRNARGNYPFRQVQLTAPHNANSRPSSRPSRIGSIVSDNSGTKPVGVPS